MQIAEVAARSGVTARNIRYYESIGLVGPAGRAANGYREFGETDLQALRFIQRARNLGFSVEDTASLLDLWRDRGRSSSRVKSLARRHLEEIDRKIESLAAMRATIQHLVDRCHGDDRPECPIIDELAGDPGDTASPGAARP